MAKRAALTLESLKAAKPRQDPPSQSESEPPSPKPANRASDNRRGQTLRLPVDAWRQLKHLATDEERTSHDLLLEALNMLFQDRGKPPIA